MNDPIHLICAKITLKRDFKTLETLPFLCTHTKSSSINKLVEAT
jgi:hypothetical protein